MSYWEATLYGVVQGLTEFLPISSSAHLALLPRLLGRPDPGLTFNVALHLGTLAAVAAYFWRDWSDLLRSAAREPLGAGGRRLALLAAASVPAAAAGVFLEDYAENVLRGPQVIACTLIVFGLFLGLADRLGRKSKSDAGVSEAIGVGLAQALALVPGTSRSGVTITAGLALGLDRWAAARFSFLLALPITAGAAVFKLRDLRADDWTGPFVWAILVSGISGGAAVHWLLHHVRRSGLWPYVAYRVALGLALLAFAA